MPRAFTANLILIISVNLLVKPLYIFGIDIRVQNVLGPEEYGLFFTLFSFTYLFQIINDFGIQVYNSRSIAQQPARLIRQSIAFLKIKGVLAVAYTIVIWLVAWLLGYTIHGKLLFLILFNQILISLVLFLRSNIAGLGMYRYDSLLSVLDKAIMIILCGMFLYLPGLAGNFSLEIFVLAQTASLLLTAAIASWIIYARSGPMPGKKLKAIPIGVLLKAAGPYALAVFLMTIYTRIDTVMIEQLLSDGKREAGVYAAGFRLLDAANMLAFLFTPLLLPMFSRILDKQKELKALLKSSFEFMWVLCISVALAGYFFRQEIIGLLYVQADAHWVNVFSLLILGYIPMGLAYVFGTLQTAKGAMRRLNILYTTLVIANILLNLLLIPAYAAEGAAIATLITQGTATAILIGFVVHDYKLPFSTSYLIRILGFALIPGISMAAIQAFLPLSFPIRLLFSIVILVTTAIASGLLKPLELVSLIMRSGSNDERKL